MFTQPFLHPRMPLVSLRNAIILVAACALSTWVLAQNTSKSALPLALEPGAASAGQSALLVQLERQRINVQRSRAKLSYDLQRQECYQRFSVNACLSRVRDEHNGLLSDLKRQEISLDDADRKRRGAQQLQRIEEKTPNLAVQQSQRLGLAQQDQALRQQPAQELEPKSQAKTRTPKIPAAPQAKAEKPQKKIPAPQRQKQTQLSKADRTVQDAANRANYDRRQQEAAQHKASVLKKQQEKAKDRSAPLPMPGN